MKKTPFGEQGFRIGYAFEHGTHNAGVEGSAFTRQGPLV
jgi:hypothetical protein